MNKTISSEDQQPSNLSDNVPKKRKRFCWIGLLSASCLGIFLLCAMLGNMSMLEKFSHLIISIMFGLLVITPFLAIGSLMRIGLKSYELKGAIISILVIGASSLIIEDMSYYKVPRARQHSPSGVVCGTRLKGLGTALTVYASDYDDVLPSSDWCDRLIEETDVSPQSFLCPPSSSVEGESDYCMNTYAAGKKLSELPSDMVLLFEIDTRQYNNEIRLPIKQRQSFPTTSIISEMFSGDEKVHLNQWNQVGGPDVLDTSRHHQGCNILFVDGTSRFITLPELANLRWDIEPNVFYNAPVPNLEQQGTFIPLKTISLIILGLGWTISSLCLLVKFKAIRYWKFALFLGLLSAAAGLFFGNMSGEAYVDYRQSGKIPGLIFGFLAGACFAAIFAGRSNNLKQSKTFGLFMVSVGMLTGIICATSVHIVLMIVNNEANPFGVIIGIPYGILVGFILGLISAAIIRKYHIHPQVGK